MKLNISNILTLARIIIIPIIVICIYLKGPFYGWVAFILFCLASITDYFDGYIARIRNEITNFGTFLDPIADKLLVAAVILILTSKKIIVTTGTIDTKIINELKTSSNRINEFLYEIDLNDAKGYLLINENFFSISHLISKSSLFISCHGAFTHIASNYKIKILDIIEKDKVIHYGKITKHMKNYKYLYRDNFERLSKNIINNL